MSNIIRIQGNIKTGWIVSGLVALVILLSIFFFQNQSLRLDEAQSLWQTSHSFWRILDIISEDVHVPLYHVLLHMWQFMFGNEVWSARLMSLIFFGASIPAIYALGSLAYTKKVGLFAATLLAISPFMNWYGNEIRMYSLFVLLALLNQYFFMSIYKKRNRQAWIGFAVTAFLGIYTHYFFFLILATNALFFLFNKSLFATDPAQVRQVQKRFIKVAIGLAVLFLPWVIAVLVNGGAGNTQPNLMTPTTVNVFNTFSSFIFGFQTDHLNTILVSLWPVTVLLGFLALKKNKHISPETIYFIMGFILPNVAAFAISFLVSPVYLARYLIFTLPMMYLILSWMFSTYPKSLGYALRTLLVLVMAATLAIESASANTPVKENYREAVEYIEKSALPSDVVAVSAPFTIYPVLYYYQGSASLTTLPIWDQRKQGSIPAFSMENLPKEVEIIKRNHDNLWLLLSYDQGYEEDLRIYFDTHFERLESKEFSSTVTLYKYKLRYE